MDQILQTFAKRISDLKTVAALRTPHPQDGITHDPLYISLSRAVEDLEKRVGRMKSKIQQEQDALKKAQAIHDTLDEQRKDLEHMLANVPKHLPMPQRQPSKTAAADENSNLQKRVNVENGSVNVGRGTQSHVAPPQSGVLEQSQTMNRPAVRPKKGDAGMLSSGTGAQKKTGHKLNTTVAPITVAEFESLPKYQVGRLSRDRLNDHISEFSQLVADKYALMRIPPAKMTKIQRETFWEHKKAATPETAGKAFITEKDVKDKEPWSKSSFRLDPAGRNVIAIMRHLGRIKEVRGGGHTRMVII